MVVLIVCVWFWVLVQLKGSIGRGRWNGVDIVGICGDVGTVEGEGCGDSVDGRWGGGGGGESEVGVCVEVLWMRGNWCCFGGEGVL